MGKAGALIREQSSAVERRSLPLRRSKGQRGEGRRVNKNHRPLLVAVRRLVLWTFRNTMKKKVCFSLMPLMDQLFLLLKKKRLGCFEGRPRQLAWMEQVGSGGFTRRSSVGDGRRSLWVVANKMSGGRLLRIITSLLSLLELILCVTLSAEQPSPAMAKRYIEACLDKWRHRHC